MPEGGAKSFVRSFQVKERFWKGLEGGKRPRGVVEKEETVKWKLRNESIPWHVVDVALGTKSA